MLINKTMLATAIAVAMGLEVVEVGAAPVSSWQLMDFDSDGLSSDFQFYAAPSGNSTNLFASGGGDGVPIVMDTGSISSNVFTTGFMFGGTAQFAPNIFGNIKADITGTTLNFSALDFGGLFAANTQFNFPPDILSNCTTGVFTGTDCGTFGFGYHTDVTPLGVGDFGVVVRFVGTINDPGGAFHNFQSNWRLEGVMSTVPVPAAAWLFGSGLAGLVAVARRKRRR